MTDLDTLLRGLLATAARLGHEAATIGIPVEQTVTDVAHGPEAGRLITGLTPLLREALR